MVRSRCRRVHKEILVVLVSGPSFRKTVLTVLCLMTLLGSSFRPMPGPGFAKGSIESVDFISAPEGLAAAQAESEDRGLYYSVYEVQRGDTVSAIAASFDVTVDTVLSANNIQSAKTLRPSQLLKVPNMSGILYRNKPGDSIASIAEKHKISADRLIEVNNLMTPEIEEGRMLFLPDARLPTLVLREISGDLFHWPVRGPITSWFSWRRDPFSGKSVLHNGLDIGVPMGTPVRAAMEGRVEQTGYSAIMGKFIIMRHASGWRTLYAHMSSVTAQAGQYIQRGGRIGLSGNTGYSTGPHLHFTVYKYGKAVNPAAVLQ